MWLGGVPLAFSLTKLDLGAAQCRPYFSLVL